MTTTTKSAKSYNEAAEMLKGYTFEYSTENYSNDYKVTYRYFNGTNEHGAKCFAMIETIEDGKLVNVRFINTYRQTAVDIKIEIDDATDTDADEYAVSEAAMEVAIAAEEANAASNMTDIEKVIAERKTMTVRELFLEAKKEVGYERNARGAKMWFISYPRYDINTEEYIGHTMPLKRTSKDVEIYLREEYCGMTLKTFLAEEKAWIDEETDKAIRQMNIDDEAFHLRDKIIRESYACDDNDDVFNLLPTLDELNDVDESAIIVKEEIVNMYGKTFSFINIYGERVSFIDGEVHIISSDKYDAHFNRKTSKYVVAVIEDGNFKPITFDTDEEFFAEMAKRGACTIDEPEPPTVDDFDSKLAKLTAQRDEAQAALLKAQETHETAEQKLQDFLTSTAADLTTKLQSLKLDYRERLFVHGDRLR